MNNEHGKTEPDAKRSQRESNQADAFEHAEIGSDDLRVLPALRPLAIEYDREWSVRSTHPDIWQFIETNNPKEPLTADDYFELVLVDQHNRWKSGLPSAIEEYFRRVPELTDEPKYRRRLIVEEFGYFEDANAEADIDSFLDKYRELLTADDIQYLKGQVKQSHDGQASTVGFAHKNEVTTFTVRKSDGTFIRPLTLTEQNRLEQAFVPGARIAERYLIKRMLGRGGMGMVFLARDERLDREVAVKAIRLTGSSGVRDRQIMEKRFVEEARLGASLLHPAIASVFDYGVHQGSPYTVFEFIPGKTLRAVMKARGPMPLNDVQVIIGPLAQALDFAHRRQIVHRDLKPENLCATEQEQFKILDFGLAKRFDQLGTNWLFAGTPAYTAPEQAAEQPSDGRADQYALAITVYEMLTGCRPFQSRSAVELLRLHQTESVTPPAKLNPGLPESVSYAICKALSKDPNDRYSSCEDFAAALGCQFLQERTSLAIDGMEAVVRIPRRTLSLNFGFKRRNSTLFLYDNAIWSIHRGRIHKWALSSLKSVQKSVSGRHLKVHLNGIGRDVHRKWKFRSRSECVQWFEKLSNSLIKDRQQQTSESGSTYKPVVLLKRAPNVRAQVLGQVECDRETKQAAEQSLVLKAAVLGADAIVDLETENVDSETGRKRRLTGKAVQAINREGALALANRWTAKEIALSARGTVPIVLLLIGMFGIGWMSSKYMPPEKIMGSEDTYSVLRPGLVMVQDTIIQSAYPALISIILPMLFCFSLQFLRWRQLVWPTMVALVACMSAPLLADIVNTVLIGQQPKDWYAQFITLGRMICQVVLVIWVLSVAEKLWFSIRRADQWHGRSPVRSKLRSSLGAVAILITVIGSGLIFFYCHQRSSPKLLARLDTAPTHRAALLVNNRFADLTLSQFAKMLRSDDPTQQEYALDQLAHYGPKTRTRSKQVEAKKLVQAIAECLSDDRPEIRAKACRTLAAFGRAARIANPQLASLLNDDNPGVVEFAFRSLESINRGWRTPVPAVAEHLVRNMPEGDYEAQRRLLDQVRVIDRNWANSPAAREWQRVLIRDVPKTDRESQQDIIAMLGHFGSLGRQAIPVLMRLAYDEDEQTVRMAKQSLNKIDRHWSRDSTFVPEAIGMLKKQLRSSDRDVRYRAMLSIGQFRNDAMPALGEIVRCLIDEDERTRALANRMVDFYFYQWYEQQNAKDELPFLIAGLDNARREIRLEAARVLGSTKMDFSSLPNAKTAAGLLIGQFQKVKSGRKVSALVGSIEKFDPNWQLLDTVPGIVDQQIAVLEKGKNREQKIVAINILLHIGSFAEKSIEALVLNFADPDFRRDYQAGNALMAINKNWERTPAAQNALQTLIGRTRSKDPRVRSRAAGALGGFRDNLDQVLNALVDCMKDEELFVRESAALALWDIGDPASSVAPQLIELLFVQHRKKDRLSSPTAGMHTNAISRLMPKWRESEAMKRAVLKNLPRLNDQESRDFVLAVMASVGPKIPELIEPVIPLLMDNKQENRSRALTILWSADRNWPNHVNASTYLDQLGKHAESDDADIRKRAVTAIGHFGPAAEKLLPVLSARLDDDDPAVHEAAVAAIGKMRGSAESLIPKLVNLIVSNEHAKTIEVRGKIDKVLDSIDPRWARRSDGRKALTHLREELKSDDHSKRLLALKTLRLFDLSKLQTYEIVLPFLLDSDRQIRQSAEFLLRTKARDWRSNPSIQTSLFIPKVIERLESDDPEIKIAVIDLLRDIAPMRKTKQEGIQSQVLGVISNQKSHANAAVQGLLPMLKDRDPSVRAHTATALGCFSTHGETIAPKLVERVGDSDYRVVRAALEALSNLGTNAKVAIPELVKMMEESEHRNGIQATLRQLGWKK